MAYFIYRTVTTTKYTKKEILSVYKRETFVFLEWTGVIETLSAEPEATVLAIKLRPHIKDLLISYLNHILSIPHTHHLVKYFLNFLFVRLVKTSPPREGSYMVTSWMTDLNPRPIDYKSIALPTELIQQIKD